MNGTINWKKKNGNEIETNDLKATVEHMESLGAIRADDLTNLPANESVNLIPLTTILPDKVELLSGESKQPHLPKKKFKKMNAGQ